MRVILTEEQLRQVIREQVIEENIISSLLGLNNPNKIIRKLVIALLLGTITFAALPGIVDRLGRENQAVEKVGEENLIDKIKKLWQNMKDKDSQVADRMRDDAIGANFAEKVEALKAYMETACKNQNYSLFKGQVSPEAMVRACEETGFDLPLLVAQAHLESCFGATPRARRTNSVFSVGSYDNGRNAVTYRTQDSSILPYINLMKNNYLVDKTVNDILQPGAFVNTKNMRYASDKNYEGKVRSIRNKIISKYPVLAS